MTMSRVVAYRAGEESEVRRHARNVDTLREPTRDTRLMSASRAYARHETYQGFAILRETRNIPALHEPTPAMQHISASRPYGRNETYQRFTCLREITGILGFATYVIFLVQGSVKSVRMGESKK